MALSPKGPQCFDTIAVRGSLPAATFLTPGIHMQAMTRNEDLQKLHRTYGTPGRSKDSESIYARDLPRYNLCHMDQVRTWPSGRIIVFIFDI